ncbi:hypothetical protein BDAP_001895 [Binucleata daphniae]
MYKCEVEVIPYVMTWDGITTKCHKSYRKRLGIDKHVEAYIQSLTIRKTLESITLDMWSTDARSAAGREGRIEDAFKVAYEADQKADEDEMIGNQ